MLNPFYEYNKFIETNTGKILNNAEIFKKAMTLSPSQKQINNWNDFCSKVDKIRGILVNEEGKENRNKMRRKYKDILFLDDSDLILWYYGYLN